MAMKRTTTTTEPLPPPFSLERGLRPGFRLHKLEVYNWGTFDSTDGRVHTVRPEGHNTLLIGRNGSGKSTLVDALLTLLVRPAIRNYNVAAGAQKRERDERTYIRGAFGRSSRDDEQSVTVQYLRPGGSNYSVLLACFRNEDADVAITLAQVLYLNSEGRAEKIYCFADDERSIAADFSGVSSMEKLAKLLKKRGFKTTRTFKEYAAWLERTARFRPLAMDVFNQTVAVKDVQSLNDFIRRHMLEARPWSDKVDDLLNHFTQLSEAWQSLVRVRRQFELLESVADDGREYRSRAEELERADRLRDATDTFFARKTIDLLNPELDRQRNELDAVRSRRAELAERIEQLLEERRRLLNEIDNAGGERLRQIPLLIEREEAQAETKRDANRRYRQALEAAGIEDAVKSADAFARVAHSLSATVAGLEAKIGECDRELEELVLERGNVRRELSQDRAELDALNRRRTNLPEHMVELRRRLCDELNLAAGDLPFAAELIAVRPDEREWEASIEKVLHGFAMSLLVPQRLYRVVGRHLDSNRLTDARGRGQRLVYLRVGETTASNAGPIPHARSLVRKLELRESHDLAPWVRGEIECRFKFRCCDTIEEFQQQRGPAITRAVHVKYGEQRHEKDDRDRVLDPKSFVLGWDNREKKRRLAAEIERLESEQARLDARCDDLRSELTTHRDRLSAANGLAAFTAFAQIDYSVHEAEIAALRREKRAIEQQSDAIRALKQRLAEAESRRKALEEARDKALRTAGGLERDVAQSTQLIENAEQTLAHRDHEGVLDEHTASFPLLEDALAADPLTVENLFVREKDFSRERNTAVERLRRQVEPLRTALTSAMNCFLREFPSELHDLQADVRYLDGFLVLRDRIIEEDLPRHEQRFRERLNEKVTQEIGLLHSALQQERQTIIDKIELLNESLARVEYRPGTYMRLEPRVVVDREIHDFQQSIRACLEGSFDGSDEANEARFKRIEEFVERLREQGRWRDKVTDVRRWFNFAAREIDEHDGSERACYEDSSGQSGGEKAKLAFTILVAAVAYQYDVDPTRDESDRFHFVVIDEMFSRVDDQYAEYALELFERFRLQLLIVAPLDAKARVTEPYVGNYLHVVKDEADNRSEIYSMTAREFESTVDFSPTHHNNGDQRDNTRDTRQSSGGVRKRKPR